MIAAMKILIMVALLNSTAFLTQTAWTAVPSSDTSSPTTGKSAGFSDLETSIKNSSERAETGFTANESKQVEGTRLVEVHGRKVEVLSGGEGKYTVVFESGLGAGLTAWSRFAPNIDGAARWVCYSRAGYRSSEKMEGPRTPKKIIENLHELLIAGGFKPPFILVGHSFGGLCVRAYAATYPTEVVGLVLEDPTYERAYIDLKRIAPNYFATLTTVPPSTPSIMKEELSGLDQVYATGTLDTASALPDIPIVLLTSIKPPAHVPPTLLPILEALTREKRIANDKMIGDANYCMQIVTNRSGHMIHSEEPGIVLDAIRWVIRGADTNPTHGIETTDNK